MESFQKDFIELLVRYEVLRFGSSTLKSGRTSPYFVNAGQLRTGRAIAGVGAAYAAVIDAETVPCDLVFGPAYKGVPLAVATATALSMGARDVPFGFDRKEIKDHGEGGQFVGTPPTSGMRVVLVDDVITSGRSLREAATLLTESADVEVSAAVVAVDRQERGRGDKTTLEELRDDLGIRVLPIVTIREVVDHLHGRELGGTVVLDDSKREAIETYLAQHSA